MDFQMQYPQTFSDAHAPAQRLPEQFHGNFVGQETYEAQQAATPVHPQQAFPDAHIAPVQMIPEQFPSHFVGQETFEAQQAAVSVQPRIKLGRPKTAKSVQEGPKRGRGRPSGAKDVVKRVQRGEKAAMSEDCKKMHMAKKRIDRKMAGAERALGAGQHLASMPAVSDMGPYPQPSFDFGSYPTQEVVQPQPQAGFYCYGQPTTDYGQVVARNFGRATMMPQHPVTMTPQYLDGAWLTC